MIRQLAVATLIFATSLVQAEADSDAAIRAAIQKVLPGETIKSIRDSAIDEDIFEVEVGAHILYISGDGKYLIQGSVYDIETNTDLTELRRSEKRKVAISTIGKDQRFRFWKEVIKPTHTVTVFTDIDCGYCQRLHNQMAEYNEQGIAIEYMMFPRAGLKSNSYDKAVSAWCADDRNLALTNAKNRKDPDPKTCDNPVADHYNLGKEVGVTGTPAIVTAQGVLIPGYVPPAALKQRLDSLAAAE